MGKGLTIEERRSLFLKNYHKMMEEYITEGASWKMVVVSLFHVYLTAINENDKVQAAYHIGRLKPEVKDRVFLWDLLDVEEFNGHLKEKRINKEAAAMDSQRRRHEKRNDFSLTPLEWENAIKFFNGKCAYCQKKKTLTYEHFVPFKKFGGFTKDNIIPACMDCNRRKNMHDFDVWFRKQEFYDKKQADRIVEYIDSMKREVKI